MGDGEVIAGTIIGGLLGFAVGMSRAEGWYEKIENFKKRLGHLAYSKAVLPQGFINADNSHKVLFSESIHAYLLGIPNSSLPTLLRCLEIGLKKKYEEHEKKESNLRLKELIDWAEKILKDEIQIAHPLRMLRNKIHEDKLVSEQDVIEAIRHVSKILDELYPCKGQQIISVICPMCKDIHSYTLSKESCIIGNTMNLSCAVFKQGYQHSIMP